MKIIRLAAGQYLVNGRFKVVKDVSLYDAHHRRSTPGSGWHWEDTQTGKRGGECGLKTDTLANLQMVVDKLATA